MSLLTATDVLNADSPVSGATPLSIGAGGTQVLVALDAADSSGISLTSEHNGLAVSADSANTSPLYILLGAGTPSATNWHICLPAGQIWPGEVGGVVWRGRVSAFSAAAAKVGVAIA